MMMKQCEHCSSGSTTRATRRAITAERALLAALEGGCQVPIGAAAVQEGDELHLHACIAALSGRTVLRASREVDLQSPAATGRALAEQLLAAGAARSSTVATPPAEAAA